MPCYMNKRIVVIDDEEIWVNKIINILHEQDYPFVKAMYPLPPFSELENIYDLAIVDIRMNRFDGFQIKDFFKAKSPLTKVILMSQFDDFDINVLHKAQGADGWFHKQDLDKNELSFILLVNSLLSQDDSYSMECGQPKNNEGETRTMGDTFNISTKGDVVVGKDKAKITLNKTIKEVNPQQNTLQDKLVELTEAIRKIETSLETDVAREVDRNFKVFKDELSQEKPRKDWYELSAKGLIEAATSIGAIGKPVIELIHSILKIT
ncbi:MAG: response regulator [Candidatus Electrothrix sp. GM3_4]|nr:response regulator [Candidatus Electrothrix sp. GM3_4]